MAIDRAGARRRVNMITAWSAGAAAALTAAFAFGAARGNHAAARTATPARSQSNRTRPQDTAPQTQAPDPQGGYGQGFTPPSSSTSPPQGMSGGS
jgi:hypothetical protein